VRVGMGDSVVDAAAAMKKGGSTEALVISGTRLSGIVTERDILYKVVAMGLQPAITNVGSIMSAPVETVEETTSVGDAIARMSDLGVRRLAVMRGGAFVGIVSQMTLASGKLAAQVSLPELVRPGHMKCPYCGAESKDSVELSKHIDQDHVGLGVLEGVYRKA
jgi:signal-transduction protein with cAMP-binding, CBS, and nucleotidyltransferase domain